MNAARSESSKYGQPGKRVSWDTKVNSAIAELSRSLLSRASIEDISSLVLRHAKSLTNSEFGFVGYIDEKTGCLVIPTFVGDIWDICRIKDKTFVFKDFRGLWGWVLNNRKPLLSNKPSGDRRSSGTPPGHLPIQRFLSVPSLVQGKLVGQISIANSDRNYTKKDLTLLDQLASIFADAIHRTRTEKAIKESEDLYRTIFETTGNATIIVEQDMAISMVNMECEKLFGYSKEEIVGIKKWDNFIVGEDLYRLREYHCLRRINPDAVPKTYETRVIDRQGNMKDVSITAALIPATKKSIISILDITKHKQAQEELRKSEEKYRTLIDNVNIGIYRNTGGPYGRFLQANPTMIKMFGYDSDEEFMKIPTYELYQDPEERKRFVEKIQKQGFVKDEKLRLRKRDGTFIWGSVTAKAQQDDTNGKIKWIDGAIEDITERKRAEERLVQSLEALHSVYNIATTMRGSYETACDQVVYNLSKLLKVSYVSVQYIEEDQVKIISRITEGTFTHNEAASLEHSPCAVVVEKKEPCQMRGPLQQIFPDNKLISIHNFKTHIGVPVKSVGGRVVGFICAMDYADRVFTEDEIRLIEIFARYVAYEYERNIMEAQLRQFDRMKLLGQMAAGVAHEVRNPLNAILAITEALFQDIGDNPEYQPFLDHIRTQVDRLSQLMGNLLDLGKPIQSSSLHREYLPAICAATLDLWQQTSLSQSHRVRLSLPPEQDDLNVMADSSKLQQVFLNLLENAAQHSPEGSEIRFVVSTPKKTTARICVIDQGTGVATENLQRVFEPFFTTRKRGNGLGLSIVKNIMQALGGDIMIRNNETPPGCTVEIILPVVQEGQS